MSVRATASVLRCDQTTTDPRKPSVELRCLAELEHVGDFDSARAAAARVGWARVQSTQPWCSDIWLDLCPDCWQKARLMS